MDNYTVKLADNEALKKKAFAIREEVFVIEQKVSRSEEFDEFESISRHFVALDAEENPVGAARWRKTKNGIKLERFAVKQTGRGQGIGQALVQLVLDDIRAMEGTGHYLYLHAQLDAVGLYQKFNFEKIGDMFEECDIQHYKMQRTS
jgi:predicted GNAT family N-acyltransferase